MTLTNVKMDSSEKVILLMQQNEVLMVQQEIFREIIQQLTNENSTLRDQNAALTVQNSMYLALIERHQDKESQISVSKEKDNNEDVIKEMQEKIEALQKRVLDLVQEKLRMQVSIEDLEHELSMTSPHATPKTMSQKKLLVDKKKNTTPKELPLDDTACTSQHECLETARRQQQAQLLLDKGNVSSRQQVIGDENYNPLFGEFDIRKELEEQLDKRTIVVRPSDEFVRSPSNQGVATSKFLRGGMFETATVPRQEAKEDNEKQRSLRWIRRIGFKGGQEAPATVVKQAHQGLGKRQPASDPAMMMECKDGIIQHSNYQQESTVSDVMGKRGRKNISTNLNLLL